MPPKPSSSKPTLGASGLILQTETEKYRLKYKELKRKVREVEAQNDKIALKTLTVKRNIQRLRLERSILYERLERNLHENQLLDPNRASVGGSITGSNPGPFDQSRFDHSSNVGDPSRSSNDDGPSAVGDVEMKPVPATANPHAQSQPQPAATATAPTTNPQHNIGASKPSTGDERERERERETSRMKITLKRNAA